MWKAREQIVFIGWQFSCFDEFHGEIIGEIFPAVHVTNPFRAKMNFLLINQGRNCLFSITLDLDCSHDLPSYQRT